MVNKKGLPVFFTNKLDNLGSEILIISHNGGYPTFFIKILVEIKSKLYLWRFTTFPRFFA